MRRAAKRDANEGDIRLDLAGAGVETWPISSAGGPDLLTRQVWRGTQAQIAQLEQFGLYLPLEVKNPSGRNRPTARQAAQSAPWPVIRTPEEALDLLKGSKCP